ncbi:MAG: hypothetical protein KatS3mg103_0615 [Phycisphaerales bacterium]|nr:MAG: hypothetical protein KatS3mg103_0615 [Phycisphaerales bacterium]
MDRASELNSDQAGGRMLRASLLQAEGRLDEALALVDSIIADGLTSVPVLYRKAQILRALGRADAAAEVYQEILRRQPDNPTNVREVVASLAQMGRLRQALEIARRSQRVAGTDPVFVDQWLRLEAEVGDATAAMLKREDVRDARPDDRSNNLALVGVYLKLGEFAKARPIIDALRAEQDDVALVMLDARWHAEQGRLPQAIEVFERYLAQRRDQGLLDARDVLTYANFLETQGLNARAIAVLRGSRSLEPDEGMPIHRTLALLLMTTGRGGEAVEVLDEMIAQGGDPDGTLELARVEAYLRAGMLEEAGRALEALSPKGKATQAAGILRADLLQRRGDRQGALRALGETLAAHPTSAMAYIRRAEILWEGIQQDPSLTDAERAQLTRDAIADLNEAVKHDPNAWEAHRLLGLIAMEQERYDDAATHIARAVQLEPGQAPLRAELVRRLVGQGDAARAMAVIDSAISANPADVQLRVGMARLMAELGRPQEALRLFESALAQRRNPEIAAQYLEFLLAQNTPQARAKAREVLSDRNLNVADTWQLQLMAAALALQEGSRPRAVAQARQSFERVRSDTTGIVRWFNALPALIKDHAVRMEIALQLGVENTPQRVGEIMLASLMLQDPSTEPQGLAELRRLAADGDATVATRAGQLLGDTLYAKGQYAQAVEAWRGVIERDPQSAQSLNNLAYVLATELDQCQEAIELARRAIEAGGVAPAIVRSTLAVALVRCERLDEAQQVAQELENLARGTPEEVLAAVRLGEVALARGDRAQAQAMADRAATLLSAWGQRAEPYRSAWSAFKDRLEGGG